MSTSTSRLQLTKSAGSDSMASGATQLSDAWTKIDAAIGVKKFATQGAATNVFNGDLILETSTGLSKLFNSPSWFNIFSGNNGRGQPQPSSTGPSSFFISPVLETTVFTKVFNVTVGRKYLANYSLAISAINNGGIQKGYCRMKFYYTTDLNADPNIFVHDVASYISAANPSRSKNLRGSFEFFPNYTGQILMKMTGLTVSGNEDTELNLGGTNPNMYMVDWGV